MLDPTRFALNAATVGFRKRTGQAVDWDSFHNAIQNQTDAINVRRELQETLVSELHVMGGQRFGIEGNAKTNEIARQQRQMNGYPLRSFMATGGAIVLPPKHGEGLMAIPMNVGLTQYTQYNAVVGDYVSKFTEPLNMPLENNTILLGRAGIAARSESASDPYKTMNFFNNMHQSLEEIRANEQRHLELRGFARQRMLSEDTGGLRRVLPEDTEELVRAAEMLAEEQSSRYENRKRKNRMTGIVRESPLNPIPQQRQNNGEEQNNAEDTPYVGEEQNNGEGARTNAIYGLLNRPTPMYQEMQLQRQFERDRQFKEATNQTAKEFILENFGERKYNELALDAQISHTEFSEVATKWMVDNPGNEDIVDKRQRLMQEQNEDKIREEIAQEYMAKNDVTMNAQMVIQYHNMEDARGGEEPLGTALASRARAVFEKIGESKIGLNNTPDRNSVPSSANFTQQASHDPFVREDDYYETFLSMQESVGKVTASAEKRRKTEQERASFDARSPQTKKGGNKSRQNKSIKQLRKEANENPDDPYSQAMLGNALQSRETLKKGEAATKKIKKTKSA